MSAQLSGDEAAVREAADDAENEFIIVLSAS